jgi:hypothetical protein
LTVDRNACDSQVLSMVRTPQLSPTQLNNQVIPVISLTRSYISAGTKVAENASSRSAGNSTACTGIGTDQEISGSRTSFVHLQRHRFVGIRTQAKSNEQRRSHFEVRTAYRPIDESDTWEDESNSPDDLRKVPKRLRLKYRDFFSTRNADHAIQLKPGT